MIGKYPDRNELLIDAGATAMHKDSAGIKFWGEIVGQPDLQMTRMSQEVCVISSEQPIDFDRFPIGTFFHILPNHSCMTASGFSEYFIVRDGVVEAVWRPVKGW